MGGEQHLSFYLGRHFRRKSNVKSEPETICYHSVSSGPEEMQSRKITGQEVSHHSSFCFLLTKAGASHVPTILS